MRIKTTAYKMHIKIYDKKVERKIYENNQICARTYDLYKIDAHLLLQYV